jgi:hypothetical protein
MSEDIKKKINTFLSLVGNWASFAAFGSFILYSLGYLSLRFYLSMLGIATDLVVFDERYLFSGARFLVYLVSSVPNLIILALLPAVIIFVCFRFFSSPGRQQQDKPPWYRKQHTLTITGIIFSLVLIQTVMRQCFVFSNLLLASSLPQHPAWLHPVLLGQDNGVLALYFPALLGGLVLTALLLVFGTKESNQHGSGRFLSWLLAFLVAVQFLLLPINHGVLIAGKLLPRVSDLGNGNELPQNQEAWLIWEGDRYMTFLVKEKTETIPQAIDGSTVKEKITKKMVVLPREQIKKLSIVSYDHLLRLLFIQEKEVRTGK